MKKNEHFYSAMHKMNLNINSKERNAVNRYKLDLWQLSDKLQDESRRITPQDFRKLANELKDLVCMFPELRDD